MSVGLYDGCWGVKREHEYDAKRVVGPFITSDSGLGFHLGNPLNWYSQSGLHCSRGMSCEIIKVFPSEPQALAWVNRKPWWKRDKVLAVLVLALLAAAVITALGFLTSCTPSTAPDRECESQQWNDSLKSFEWVKVSCTGDNQ